MTTYKGIAAVTQTLGYLLGAAVRSAVPEARVTLARPEQPPASAADEPRLNVYLVQTLTEPTMRSNDLPTRDGHGTLLNPPQAPLNLRYLLTFFGATEKAHLMLGIVELALREHALLEPAVIRQATGDHPDLSDAGVDEQVPRPRIVPAALTLDEMIRFWSGFHDMPYTLSTVYDVQTVILTASSPVAASLPVRAVRPAAGGLPPQLHPLPTVQAAKGGTTVDVSGRGLRAGMHVRVAGHSVPLVPGAAGGLAFRLPADAPAGPQPVALAAGGPPQTLRVRPEIERATVAGSQLEVRVRPAVRPGQHAVLSLVDTSGADEPPRSAQLTLTVTEPTSTVRFSLPATLRPGSYLAMLEIDGVGSLPTMVRGRYARPIVRLA